MAWHPFRNLGLKVAALGLGTLLWFTVSGQQVERTVSRVPVVYRNVPTGLRDHGRPARTPSTVHVRGSENQISRLQTDEVERGRRSRRRARRASGARFRCGPIRSPCRPASR